MPDKIIYRFAPTPSGYLHLGNVASFMFTILLAKNENANLNLNPPQILLRIDDLDSDRTRSICIDDIFRTLELLEIDYQIGPKNTADFYQNYSQLTRLPLYNAALNFLKESNQLYACSCSRKDREQTRCNCSDKKISFDAPQVAWRIKIDSNKKIESLTENGTRQTCTLNDDFVVRQKNSKPAYQLATVVDDIHFGVNRIVRGEDLFPSTLMQIYLASLLPAKNYFDSVKFWHHPLLKDREGVKLSKSAGATAINSFTNIPQLKKELEEIVKEWMYIKPTFFSFEKLVCK